MKFSFTVDSCEKYQPQMECVRTKSTSRVLNNIRLNRMKTAPAISQNQSRVKPRVRHITVQHLARWDEGSKETRSKIMFHPQAVRAGHAAQIRLNVWGGKAPETSDYLPPGPAVRCHPCEKLLCVGKLVKSEIICCSGGRTLFIFVSPILFTLLYFLL